MLKPACLGLAAILGILAEANGIFMLTSPQAWYFAVPGVIDTGPFNQHFVRDIGLIFLLLGGTFLLGVARADLRVMLWAFSATWLSGHALFHFWEVAVGICSPSVLPRDFPAVTLPAILALLLTIWAVRDARGEQGATNPGLPSGA